MSKIDDMVTGRARDQLKNELDAMACDVVRRLGLDCLDMKQLKLHKKITATLATISKEVFDARIERIEQEALEAFVAKHLFGSKTVVFCREYPAWHEMPNPTRH